jgi:hypothetical protein
MVMVFIKSKRFNKTTSKSGKKQVLITIIANHLLMAAQVKVLKSATGNKKNSRKAIDGIKTG